VVISFSILALVLSVLVVTFVCMLHLALLPEATLESPLDRVEETCYLLVVTAVAS
jgi:hypothetical protein